MVPLNQVETFYDNSSGFVQTLWSKHSNLSLILNLVKDIIMSIFFKLCFYDENQ